jgi:hypothetical protein
VSVELGTFFWNPFSLCIGTQSPPYSNVVMPLCFRLFWCYPSPVPKYATVVYRRALGCLAPWALQGARDIFRAHRPFLHLHPPRHRVNTLPSLSLISRGPLRRAATQFSYSLSSFIAHLWSFLTLSYHPCHMDS